MLLRDIASRLSCRLEGDGDIDIVRVAGLEEAGPGDLTFFTNPRYAAVLERTSASAVILGDEAPAAPCAMLRSPHPYLSFAEALDLFGADDRPDPGVHPTSVVAPEAVLGEDVSIGAYVVIGPGARIGDRAVLHPHAVIGRGATLGADVVVHAHASVREGCLLGDRVVLQNGAVIGSDGYGFVTRKDGSHRKIPQRARVVLEDDVEVGANTTIDRPAVGETRIGAGTKIDNLVQVAHGVHVGRHTLIVAQVGIAGSTTIGDHVVLAGQVGVAGHLTIGDRVRATAQTGIPNSVDPGAFISGYPAIDNRDWLRSSAVFRRLPELKRLLHELSKRVAALEAGAAPDKQESGGK